MKAAVCLFALVVAFGPTSSQALSLQGRLLENDVAEQATLKSLEGEIRTLYEALPRTAAGGLPGSNAIRYLARRFLSASRGWTLKGFDYSPLPSGGVNASYAVAQQAASILPITGGMELGDRQVLESVLSGDPSIGFTIAQAAEVVQVLENTIATEEAKLMQWAMLFGTRIEKDSAFKQSTVLHCFAVLYLLAPRFAQEALRSLEPPPMLRRRLAEEVKTLAQDFDRDMIGKPLAETMRMVANNLDIYAPGGDESFEDRMKRGMGYIRKEMQGRQRRNCHRLRDVFTSLDHEATGQVPYISTYGMRWRDWALLESPEYLNEVGALVESGARAPGPGVLIPNYVQGMNTCRDLGSTRVGVRCCPDECELEILPRLEAASHRPAAPADTIWSAVKRVLAGDKLLSTPAKKALRMELYAIAARSPDGQVQLHGRDLATWLHRAFPRKCRMPTNGPLVADPSQTPHKWVQRGKYLPLNAEEIAEISTHLRTRWGADGTGTDPSSFAFRSSLGLTEEMQLVSKLHKAATAGGPPIKEALEDALNVRVLSPRTEDFTRHLGAAAAAGITLLLLRLLRASQGRCTEVLYSSTRTSYRLAVRASETLGSKAWQALFIKKDEDVYNKETVDVVEDTTDEGETDCNSMAEAMSDSDIEGTEAARRYTRKELLFVACRSFAGAVPDTAIFAARPINKIPQLATEEVSDLHLNVELAHKFLNFRPPPGLQLPPGLEDLCTQPVPAAPPPPTLAGKQWLGPSWAKPAAAHG